LKGRFYALTGLNAAGVPSLEWHRRLAEVTTGFAVTVKLPGALPGAPEGAVVVDQPVATAAELREALARRLPHAVAQLQDKSLVVIINDDMVLGNEGRACVRSGDALTLLPMLAGG
jgi:aldehyde:ferredoxin oxidoreductase